jgi:hypothetical protein
MTGVEHISDYQLYALFHNEHIKDDLRIKLNVEYKQRSFSNTYEEELRSRFLSVVHPGPHKVLEFAAKAGILLLPSLVVIHAIIANLCFLTKGNYMAWNEYWRYIILGNALWLTFVLILAHFVI